MTEKPKLTKAQRELVESHVDLAHTLALEYWRKTGERVDFRELVSVAYQGLAVAASRYDLNYEHADQKADYDPVLAFGSYARQRIRGQLMDWSKSEDHVPRRQRAKYKNLQHHGHGQGRTPEELAELTGMPLAHVRAITMAVEATSVSLDSSPEHWDGHYSGEPVSALNTEESVSESTLFVAATDVLDNLPELAQQVIVLRYYFGHELGAVASMLGMSTSVVRQVHSEAVLALHSALVREAA